MQGPLHSKTLPVGKDRTPVSKVFDRPRSTRSRLAGTAPERENGASAAQVTLPLGEGPDLAHDEGDALEHEVDDAYLVQRAQEGYLDAYAELVSRHAPLAYRVALRIVGDHHDAEDVAQEALVAAWQQLPRFRGESAYSTWLYRIVTRRALNRIQRDRRPDSLDLLADQPDESNEPARTLERDLTTDAVSNAVQALPPAQRIVVVLHHLEGLPYAEVAAITGSSVPAVRSHLFRARRTLGTALAEWR